MTITLIRHAPVIADWDVRLRIDELPAWIETYNRAPVDMASPDPAVYDAVSGARWIVASSLRRTRDSLEILGLAPDESDPLFDEAPVPDGSLGPLRLRPMQWLSYFRVRALLGWLLPQSSMRQLTQRADTAAEHLFARARTHGDVVLMGHGAINHFIGKSLVKKGWRPARKGGIKNWGYTVFVI